MEIESNSFFSILTLLISSNHLTGLPWWKKLYSAVKDLPANEGDAGSIPASEDPLETEMTTLSAFLPGKPRGQRSLTGYGTQGHKTVEPDVGTKDRQQSLDH